MANLRSRLGALMRQQQAPNRGSAGIVERARADPRPPAMGRRRRRDRLPSARPTEPCCGLLIEKKRPDKRANDDDRETSSPPKPCRRQYGHRVETRPRHRAVRCLLLETSRAATGLSHRRSPVATGARDVGPRARGADRLRAGLRQSAARERRAVPGCDGRERRNASPCRRAEPPPRPKRDRRRARRRSSKYFALSRSRGSNSRPGVRPCERR